MISTDIVEYFSFMYISDFDILIVLILTFWERDFIQFMRKNMTWGSGFQTIKLIYNYKTLSVISDIIMVDSAH